MSTLFAQNPYTVHYTTQNSPLPSNTIKEVLADTNGNIWMTTNNGLVKYTAGNWEIYNTSNSGIHSNNLSYFYIDNKNNVWFRAYDSNNDIDYFKKFDGINWSNEDTSGEFAGYPFAIDDNGGKWGYRLAGFDNANLAYTFNGNTTIYTNNDIGILIYGAEKLFVDKNNRFWIVGEDMFPPMGISYFSNDQWHTKLYTNNPNVGGFDIDYERGIVWLSQTINSYAGFTTYAYDDLNINQRFNATTDQGFHFINDVKIDSTGDKLFVLKRHYSSSYSRLDCFNSISGNLETLFEFLNDACEDLELDKYMNKYVTGNDGLYIINEEGIIFNKSIARNRNLNFDSTYVDSLSYKSVWIFNPYDSLLTIDSINFTSNDFYIENNSLIELAPLDSIEFSVIFNPSHSRIYFEGMNVYDNYAKHIINLNAKGFGVTDVDDKSIHTINFNLSQNFPNPFNPSTIINYQLPKAGNVTLKVFDVLGREVATLVDEYRNAGTYEVEFNLSAGRQGTASGIYFYQLKAGDPSTGSGQGYVETKKMILLK
jgi:hypothetical protein